MKISTDRVTVLADVDADEIQYYGPDASHWATVRMDTAVDLVRATDDILAALEMRSLAGDVRAWQNRAQRWLDATVILLAVALVVEPLIFAAVMASCL